MKVSLQVLLCWSSCSAHSHVLGMEMMPKLSACVQRTWPSFIAVRTHMLNIIITHALKYGCLQPRVTQARIQTHTCTSACMHITHMGARMQKPTHDTRNQHTLPCFLTKNARTPAHLHPTEDAPQRAPGAAQGACGSRGGCPSRACPLLRTKQW